jgi:uncharacterized repeat protein (TIGR04076 family)
MAKCKITVLETQFNDKLAREYGVEDLGPCPFHKVGQVFEAGYAKPEGLCDEAWKAIQHYVFALVHGTKGTFFANRWVRQEGSPSIAVMTGSAPLFSSPNEQIKTKELRSFETTSDIKTDIDNFKHFKGKVGKENEPNQIQ